MKGGVTIALQLGYQLTLSSDMLNPLSYVPLCEAQMFFPDGALNRYR